MSNLFVSLNKRPGSADNKWSDWTSPRKVGDALAVLVSCAALLVGGWYISAHFPAVEIGVEDYQTLLAYQQEVPALRPLVLEAMADGRISVLEWDDLRCEYARLHKQQIKEILQYGEEESSGLHAERVPGG